MQKFKQGKIISFDWGKGFGFIMSDNESFFFHKSFLPSDTGESDVIIGDLYSFDPTPGRKGMEARNLKRVNCYKTQKVVETFIINQSSNPKSGSVAFELPVVSCMFDSPDDAKIYLKNKTLQAGGNALLNVKYFKDTFSQPSGRRGRYYFTVHGYTANIALVISTQFVSSESECTKSNKTTEEAILNFKEQVKEIQMVIKAEREEQYSSKCFIATTVYGCSNCWQVNQFRSFRDNVLKCSVLGRIFIRFYYSKSPRIAQLLEGMPLLRLLTKHILDFFLRYLPRAS